MLSDHPHLCDPRGLAQRQMRADYPKRPPVMHGVDHDSAPVAVTGQVQKNGILDLDIRGHEQNDAQKPVTFRSPTQVQRRMGVAQTGGSLDPWYVQKTAMRADVLISLL